ncbi:uncharacterized protein LOC110715562 [Chenopodium quinoa]|uniref:uncharacterized protein LOC110715562 n=1 Tax=Chenopodium quinoa TaxID=63459 RepID=UPI000B798036|nr:uncharacterized protein LOC110715562 [Chenopodium quinoa]
MTSEHLGFHGLYRFVLLLLVSVLVLNLSHVVRGRILEQDTSNYESAPPKGTVKTIKGEDGDVVDCVDIRKQPALNHPLLKDHKIQMDPSSSLKMMNQSNPTTAFIHQLWHKNGFCSEDTVPIRRRQLQDQPPTNDTIKGPHNEVFPKHYGDHRTRFFIYFTTDDSLTTRCWDLDCNGFVQVNNKFSLGAYITQVSTIGGDLYELKIAIFQDRKTGNWWLSVMDTSIGYWPASLFPGLPEGATSLEWGGSVYDSIGIGPHTDTNMGNGLFPDLRVNKASYVCSLQYVDESFTLQIPERSNLFGGGTNPFCYNAQLLPELDPDQGLCFLFGGPGKNPKCP